MDKATLELAQFPLVYVGSAVADSFESRIGSQAVETQQQPLLNRFSL